MTAVSAYISPGALRRRRLAAANPPVPPSLEDPGWTSVEAEPPADDPFSLDPRLTVLQENNGG